MEAITLRELLTDPVVAATCKRALDWDSCVNYDWRFHDGMEDATLGLRIASIVSRLDALHLRPTSIARRLRRGVKEACFGIKALLRYLRVFHKAKPKTGD